MSSHHVLTVMMAKAFKKQKKLLPDLDETSFNWGYVAAINDMELSRMSSHQDLKAEIDKLIEHYTFAEQISTQHDEAYHGFVLVLKELRARVSRDDGS